MTLKQYIPISVVLLVAMVAFARYVGMPAAPFVIILLAAETLVGCELEDHRVPRFFREVFGSRKSIQH